MFTQFHIDTILDCIPSTRHGQYDLSQFAFDSVYLLSTILICGCGACIRLE